MEDQKHIVYILTKLELGGAQKVCLALMKGAQETGRKVTLISGSQGVLVEQAKKLGSTILLDSFKREVGIKSLWNELKTFVSIIGILRSLKKKSPHLIIHTHSTKAGLIGRWAAFFAGIKKRVHTIHGYGFHDYSPWWQRYTLIGIEWLCSLITTHYVCVSKKDRDTGVRLFPWFEKKSSIIRAAVDSKKFYIPAVLDKKHKEFTIGTISCFKPQKNLLDLLKAFTIVEKSTKNNIRLQIIGDGIMRPQLQEYIKKNNLSHQIDLLGWQHDVAPWLKTWDLFALSSLWEGLPCSIIEARLAHLPVIAYDVGGINEVIYDSVNGFLVKPGNWKELARKICKVINNTTLHQSLSNHSDALAPFKNRSMLKQHLKLYKVL